MSRSCLAGKVEGASEVFKLTEAGDDCHSSNAYDKACVLFVAAEMMTWYQGSWELGTDDSRHKHTR